MYFSLGSLPLGGCSISQLEDENSMPGQWTIKITSWKIEMGKMPMFHLALKYDSLLTYPDIQISGLKTEGKGHKCVS